MEITKDIYEESCKELLESRGTPVMIDSVECKEWQEVHDKVCGGCSYELGCGKYVGLLLAAMDTNPMEKLDKILEAGSPDFVDDIDFDFPEDEADNG